MADKRLPFICPLDDQVPFAPPLDWNMTNPQFSMEVFQRLLWSQQDISDFGRGYPNTCEPQIDSKGSVSCPMLVFVPYPNEPDNAKCWLACIVYYLNLNDSGKLVTGQTSHRVAVLSSPKSGNGVVDAYLIQSALMAAFTPKDRIRPVQADKWLVLRNGKLVNLAELLGFAKSAFSSSPKKSDAAKSAAKGAVKELRGLGALQKKFRFSSKFIESEDAVVADLRAKLPGTTVRRWLFSRQPVTRLARTWVANNGVRLSHAKAKALMREDEEEHPEDAEDEGVGKKKQQKKKASSKEPNKKSKRDHSPVRKQTKKAKKSTTPQQQQSNADVLANLQEQVLALLKANQLVTAQLLNCQ